ncbi:TonB-dependent receptor [Granulicella sp. WH15]|uniref:TonB-dependent receptor n=1 Tax=Granulicella sp. WH15 TaxID=2602070 RepID=UPI001366D982|nr:TonB-dependent receptor [Granulicella sp. WH15]QHN03164.1 TonB-dependent receptor [Granulicella sp. WH15]
MRRLAAYLFFVLFFAGRVFAQGSNASLTGVIQDSSKAFIPDVRVLAINTDTNQKFEAKTNKDGNYSIPSLPVGPYQMQIEKLGFRTILKEDLFLHTQDVLQINFQMAVGSTSETVTVTGEGAPINTSDATVGTVIDRQFVADIPMNGRSFQSLVALSPGVLTNTPQASAATPANNNQGQFSVNGMRSDANNFTVDGASAMNAPAYNSYAGSAGAMPSGTALGTTQSIISVDAMEEFKIATSSYSAEYGRLPGAQVSFRSRSGTNDYHGTAYDYLRNSAFDANNWFNTYSTSPLPTPKERQNDFGGTFGGPISIPRVYSGKDHLFFFFSYEGLRLTLPSAASITTVPSNGTFNTATYTNPAYKNLRANAPAALQPLLNAYPLPNCSTATNPQCVDNGLGGSPFIFSATTRGLINSINARVDYQIAPTMRLFARYSDTISNTSGPTALDLSATNTRNRIYLLGLDHALRGNIANELRLQYSSAVFNGLNTPGNVGGAVPINLYTAQGLPNPTGETLIEMSLPSGSFFYEENDGSSQYQPNALDTVSWSHGRHLVKAGVNYLQTTAYYGDGTLSRGPRVVYNFTNADTVLSNAASITAQNILRTDPTTKNLGLFVQDEWHLFPRLSLSLGLRWDVNPPPSVSGAPTTTYTGNVNNPSSLGLSKPGAPLFQTTYTDFAPRLGVAVTIYDAPGHELVFRGGGGLFYDSISLNGTYGGGTNLGAASQGTYTGHAFPLTASQILLPVTINPPYSFLNYPANNIVPPYSIQWNGSLEQALGQKQTVTVGYVVSLGRKLSTIQQYSVNKFNPLFNTFYLFVNGPGSNYNSLQMKYQRQLNHGLQALASYTWSHAIDWATADNSRTAAFPLQRGNSDNDVRNNFTAALVYNLPTNYENRFVKSVLGYWNADLWFVARSAFPYEPVGPAVVDPATGYQISGELNYNGKQPYVNKAGIPGGRQVDPTIFSVTASPLGAGNAPRNFLRGFGENQANFAVQRSFPLFERSQLQFRAEAFNVANHPAFGTVNTTCGVTAPGATCNNVLMGQATNTLSNGLGGSSALYQQGGPRSLQFMLKLLF